MILAAVAMLVIIVQASVLIAHNISDPIRRLSEVCQSVSESPEQEELDMEEYLGKADRGGPVGRAFARDDGEHPNLYRRTDSGQNSE